MNNAESGRRHRIAVPPLLTGYLLGMIGTVLSALALLALASGRTGTGAILAAAAVVMFVSGYATYRVLRASVGNVEKRSATSLQVRSMYEQHYPHK